MVSQFLLNKFTKIVLIIIIINAWYLLLKYTNCNLLFHLLDSILLKVLPLKMKHSK